VALNVDLSVLRHEPGKVRELDLTCDHLDGLENGLCLLHPLHLTGRLVGGDRQVTLEGHIKATMEAPCDRCLAPVVYPLDFTFTETLVSAHDAQVMIDHGADADRVETESWIYEDSPLDLNYLIANVIITKLPSQHLCREDCKGLCPHCGANLNLGPCNCQKQEIDPRWAVLAQLEDKDEEV
jgi:uncharacterized protein